MSNQVVVTYTPDNRGDKIYIYTDHDRYVMPYNTKVILKLHAHKEGWTIYPKFIHDYTTAMIFNNVELNITNNLWYLSEINAPGNWNYLSPDILAVTKIMRPLRHK